MIIKRLLNYFFLILIFMQFFSCVAVSVRDREIDDIEIEFKVRGKYAERILEPGQTYTVDVRVFEKGKSRPIKHPNFDEFIVETNGNLAIVKKHSSKLQVMPTLPSGEWLFDSSYALRLTIPDNAFRGAVKGYGTDWASFNRLDYSAKSGSNGTNGLSGYGSTRIGGHGGNGGNGQNGPTVTFQAAFVYGDDTHRLPDGTDRMVLLYRPSLDVTYLMSAGGIFIDVSGGNGGDGGRGGSGANGELNNNGRHGLDGGMGGNGGDGGDGGDGGEFYLTVPTGEFVDELFSVNTYGGQGGYGGSGGSGGNPATRVERNKDGKIIREITGRRGPQGHNGRSGRNGRQGHFTVTRIPIDTMFIDCSFLAARPEVRELMKK